MTREEAKRRAELYSALAEGKTIQILNMEGNWVDVEVKKLNYIPETLKFRIKPETNYRPFKTQEECWNEMLKHQPFGFLSIADKRDYFSICRVFEEEGKPKIWLTNNTYGDCDMTTAFVIFKFIDGTPFGIKEE